MVKEHNVRVTIVNKSGLPMTYKAAWYDSGRLADTYAWPNIEGNDKADILNYEYDHVGKSCSGYVQYEIGDTLITFAFSNPIWPWRNKLGVGTGGGKNVWDNMTHRDYNPFVETIKVNKGNVELNFNCQCTPGTTNHCTINIST